MQCFSQQSKPRLVGEWRRKGADAVSGKELMLEEVEASPTLGGVRWGKVAGRECAHNRAQSMQSDVADPSFFYSCLRSCSSNSR